jgi:hypothetical protein
LNITFADSRAGDRGRTGDVQLGKLSALVGQGFFGGGSSFGITQYAARLWSTLLYQTAEALRIVGPRAFGYNLPYVPLGSAAAGAGL